MKRTEIYTRFLHCQKCAHYPQCAESQKLADPNAQCPLTPPKWRALVVTEKLLNSTPSHEPQISQEELKAQMGRELWKELHQICLFGQLTPEWLSSWETKIPAFGCRCRQHYKRVKKRIPPRFNDAFAWSVQIHNRVNRKLGKPSLNLEEARAIWNSCQASD